MSEPTQQVTTEDCAPRLEVIVTYEKRTPQEQAAFEWLARKWCAIAMRDSAAPASAVDVAEVRAAA